MNVLYPAIAANTASKPARKRWAVDPAAFALAGVLAPLIFAALFFWIFLIPAFGVVLGAPLYLCVALPIFAVLLARNDCAPSELALIGIAINLAALPAIYLLWPSAVPVYGFLGSVHAPAWAYIFGRLYRRFRRDPFRFPVNQ